jgi:hypothetical protein
VLRRCLLKSKCNFDQRLRGSEPALARFRFRFSYGRLMPAKKGQTPPDLRYFKPPQK